MKTGSTNMEYTVILKTSLTQTFAPPKKIEAGCSLWNIKRQRWFHLALLVQAQFGEPAATINKSLTPN